MTSSHITGNKTSNKTGESELLIRGFFETAASDMDLDIEANYASLEDEPHWNESSLIGIEKPIKSNTQIRDLGDENFVLTEPILITIEEYLDEDTVIASWPEVESFAEGVTETEAIGNLKFEILDLYEELIESDPKELGPKPTAWLRILSRLITMV